MAFTKKIAKHDRITIDGVDYSNAFRSFGLTSEATEVDVSGFSVSGTDENLSGPKAQGFQGDWFLTAENENFLFQLHKNDSIFEVAWQPDGLVDSTRKTYHANCQLRTFSPTANRGDPYVSTATFSVADDNGITTS